MSYLLYKEPFSGKHIGTDRTELDTWPAPRDGRYLIGAEFSSLKPNPASITFVAKVTRGANTYGVTRYTFSKDDDGSEHEIAPESLQVECDAGDVIKIEAESSNSNDTGAISCSLPSSSLLKV